MYSVEQKEVVSEQATETETPNSKMKAVPKLVSVSVPPNDADRFRQSHRCGDIVPIYNIKYESKIEDFVLIVDNPFDLNPSNMEGFKPSANVRKGKAKSKSIYKRKKQYISSIKDEDIRNELTQGSTLSYYFEQK
jgi:hypothetical protein